MTKRAAIYARYSSHNQREESIEIQLDNCRSYCADNNLRVVAEYTDYATSGRTSDRAEFQRMMTDARAGIFDVVVIWKVTRIMRNRDEMALTRLTLKDAGVEIAYAGETVPDGSSGLLMLGMLEVLAEWESAQTAERIRGGIQKNAQRLQASGVRLFGYNVDASDHFIVDENTAPGVRLAFEMILDGSTIADVVRALAPYRSKWGRPLSQQSVTNMLRNERYTGIYSYAGVREVDGMPAIIDRETFEKVQEILDSRNPKPRDRGHRYVLVGRLFDSNGKPMTGTSATGRNGKKHYYYRTKDGKRIRCDVIERAVADRVAAALADSVTREKIADVFDEFQNGLEKEQPDKEAQRIKAKIAHIESAIEDGLPFDKDRLLALHARLDDIESRAIRAPKRFARHEVLALLESAAQMDAQRAIDIFVDCVVYDEERTAVSFSFDDAPTSDERLAQIVNWWTRTKSTPTIYAVLGGVVLVA